MFKDRWEKLKPGNKKRIVYSLCAIIILLLSFAHYTYKNRNKPLHENKKEETREVGITTSLLKNALVSAKKTGEEEQGRELEAFKKELEKKFMEALENARKEGEEKKKLGDKPNLENKSEKSEPQKVAGFPPAPPPKRRGKAFSFKKDSEDSFEPEKFFGSIKVVSAPPQAGEEEGKKKESVIYLPPSFMPATLLSGLDAPVVDSGKDNPMPVLIRIKDLAVLPNKVKANLKGCFVIAHGYGDLASERAYLRLVTLSCLDKDGQAVIDQEIKGFVVDQDGKNGLSGNVVSKMGSVIARAFLAGFFEGMGDYMEAASSSVSVSSDGTTITTIDPNKVSEAGLGQGLSEAAGKLQDFYMELAEQTMPVIEVGATKEMTIVITEGSELKIKELGRRK